MNFDKPITGKTVLSLKNIRLRVHAAIRSIRNINDHSSKLSLDHKQGRIHALLPLASEKWKINIYDKK